MRNILLRAGNRLLRPYGWTKSQILRVVHRNHNEDYPIDFVITWVDGNDPEWRRKRAMYNTDADSEANPEARYRDWGLLRYWFRAIERYAPWVHKVYFVTCGQKPEWLNLGHEKLVFVSHQDFIPLEYLPTFNSHTIELNLWRIPGLSEHFIYFNDDCFLNRPVQPEDFYQEGLPKLCSLAVPFRFDYSNGINKWKRMLLNDIAVVNTTFDIREIMRTYPEKFFSYVYHRMTRYNKFAYNETFLSGMHHTHSIQIYRKSVFPEIWNKKFLIMDGTCRSRFRNVEQVTSFLPILWQIFQGRYYPVPVGYFGKTVTLISERLQEAVETIQSEAYRVVCLNDDENVEAEGQERFMMVKAALQKTMQEKYPVPSKFEKGSK